MTKIIPELTEEEIENAEVSSMGHDGNFSIYTWCPYNGTKTVNLNIRDVLHLLKDICEKDVANHE